LRVVIQPEVLVAGHQMPLWPSVLALVIFAGLSIWLWKLSRVAPMKVVAPALQSDLGHLE